MSRPKSIKLFKKNKKLKALRKKLNPLRKRLKKLRNDYKKRPILSVQVTNEELKMLKKYTRRKSKEHKIKYTLSDIVRQWILPLYPF